MSILHLLSSSQGHKSNDTNIALAKKLATTNNTEDVEELIQNLENKDKKIQSDCIKVLYEIGYINSEPIAEHYLTFIKLLNHKNNRMVWGSMIALSTITKIKHKEIFSQLNKIMDTVNKGSVITKDCGVMVLAALNTFDEYFDITDNLLAEQLWNCPIKQLPMYLEKSLESIRSQNKEIYLAIIDKRLGECEKESQKKRLEKIRKAIK